MKSKEESINLISNCFKEFPLEYQNSELLIICFYDNKIHNIRYNPKTKEISEPLPDVDMLYVMPEPKDKPIAIKFEE